MRLTRLALFSILLMTGACSQNSPATAAPSPTLTTDTLTGTLAPQGATSQNFTVSVTGTVSITLTSVGPPSTITVGLGIGTPSGTTCTLVSSLSTMASATAQLTGTATPGTYCISVYDTGNLVAPVDYVVTVSHP